MEATQHDDELQRRAESAIGKVLHNKWRLDRLLGIGGMAAVFAATHRNGKRAAVKVLHPEAALAPTVKDRFLREGYLANKVDHPGAVSILDDDVDVDGTVFLVMELLQGETLDARLSRSGSRLGGAELLQIVHQVLDCLTAAHDKGIVHRDLKPGNLFITQGGMVKILDFGIARLEEVGQTRPGSTGAQTLGTPGFMPPEQARGRWEEVDAQSDLWAMGAVMFAALTGKHVHEAATVNEQLLLAMTVPVEKLQLAVKEAPDALAALVDRALSFSKEGRFPSAAAMRDAVRAAYEAIEGKPLAQAPRLSVRPPPATSVNPNAATLDGSAEVLLRGVTTARPVTDTPLGLAKRPSRKFVLGIAAATLGALVAAVVVATLPKASPGASPNASGREARSLAREVPHGQAPLEQIAPALGTSSAESGPAAAVAALPNGAASVRTKAVAPTRRPPGARNGTPQASLVAPASAPTVSTASPSAPPGPAPQTPQTEVDLFTKRR